eukprot:TRINITY_DN12602_c3_g1_i2.p1 TRINITY_DN12602_c3_g1~~TRINITY_DN12602_c3_g1_i2.p1  ORF type:complete len:1107 (+),score=419.77 TRINITY_DN12602_c3_g1_i2:67-3321(+)
MPLSVAAWRDSVAGATQVPRPAQPQPSQPSTAPAATTVAARNERPQSAQCRGGGRSDKLRPLGPAPPAHLRTGAAVSSPQVGGPSGARGYLAQLKSSILLVQRGVDAAKQGREEIMDVSPDMRSLEQRLLGIQYDDDPLNFCKTQVLLLETLLRGMSELTSAVMSRARRQAALRQLCPPLVSAPPPGAQHSGQPSRALRPSTAPVARPSAPSSAGFAASLSAADGVLGLTKLLGRLCERQEAWEEHAAAEVSASVAAASPAAQSTSEATPTAAQPPPPPPSSPPAGIDSALQQPAVSQLQQLIVHQQKLQGALVTHLKHSGAIPAEPTAATNASTQTMPTPSQTPAPPQPPQPASLTAETRPPQKRVSNVSSKPGGKSKGRQTPTTENDTESVRQATFAANAKLADLEAKVERARCAGVVGFADLDSGFLSRHGIALPRLPASLSPPASAGAEAKAEAVARTQELIAAVRAACSKVAPDAPPPIAADSPSKPPPKGKKHEEEAPSLPQQVVEFAFAVTSLVEQNEVLLALQAAAKGLEEKQRQASDAAAREIQRVKAANVAISDKLRSRERDWSRQKAELAAALETTKEQSAALERELRTATKEAPTGPRIATDKDPPTVAELQKAAARRAKATEAELERLRVVRQGLVGELAEARAASERLQQQVAAERSRTEEAVNASRLCMEREKDMEKRAAEAQADAEASRLKVMQVSAQREDDADRIRKLMIELNISKGTVRLLREREDVAAREGAESSWQCEHLRKQLEASERQRAGSLAASELELRRLEEEVSAYKQAAKVEREAQLRTEKELGRLRETERRLEQLQRDFANYTISKVRQGEEHEEDERIMQEVLEMLSVDLFRLPNPDATTDEVELAINQLRDKRQRLETEQRQQERMVKRKSAKAQIVDILKRRMNSIQVFAFTAKRTELQKQEQLRDLVENATAARAAHAEEIREAEGLRVQLEGGREEIARIRSESEELERQRAEFAGEVKRLEAQLQSQGAVLRKQQLELAEAGTQLDDTKRRLDRAVCQWSAAGSPHAGSAVHSPGYSTTAPEVSPTGESEKRGGAEGGDVDDGVHPALRA